MTKTNLVALKDITKNILDNRGKTPPLSESGHELIETTSLVGGSKFVDFANVMIVL